MRRGGALIGRLIGVGVGPGDPELLTIKALRLLKEAEVVFVPVAAAPGPVGTPGLSGGAGRAEAVVRAYVDPARVVRLPFALAGGESPRQGNWERAAAEVVRALEGGKAAAFATIGDPTIYSTFSYLAAAVRLLLPGVGIELVAGITAMQELAVRCGLPLVEATESLALLPFTAGAGAFRAALDHGGTVVTYKGGRHLPEILDQLAGSGRLDTAVYGARLGLPDEWICPAREMVGREGPYLSTLIVPAQRPARGPRP